MMTSDALHGAPPTLVNGEDKTPFALFMERALADFLGIEVEVLRSFTQEEKEALVLIGLQRMNDEEARLAAEREELGE